MANLMRMLIVLCTPFAAFTIAAPFTSNESSLVARGYSVPQTPGDDGIGPWPVRTVSPDQGNDQPVWYCFVDETALSLQSILTQAIGMWLPATNPNSALTITRHPLCTGSCICSDLPQPTDALVIEDTGTNGECVATVGYDYIAKEETNRHYLRCGRTYNEALDVRKMAHELGHVIGLLHEHQRPDRDTWISYRCYNMIDYKTIEDGIEEVDDPVFDGATDAEDRMLIVCNEAQPARDYLPAATEFMEGDEIWPGYPTDGGAWDEKSIMNYGSFQNAAENNGALEYAVIVAKDGDDFKEIFQGGNADPAQASISAGDIARVQYLYPLGLNAS